MGTFWKVVIAFFMASLCLGLQAAKAPPAKEPAKAQAKKRGPPINYQDSIMISQLVNDERKASFLKFMMLRQTLLIPLTDTHCKYQTGGVVCVIQVPVYLLTDPMDPTKTYCAAAFPELVTLPGAAAPGNPEKTIVWYLDPQFTIPSGAKFTFYSEKDHGIILLKDDDKQMHDGELGDGTQAPSAPPDATKYLFRHKNNKGQAVSIYLPIVVRTDTISGSPDKVSVCGTPDPRIAND
jgi:hypothetical protein